MPEEEILFSLSKNQGTYCCTKSKVCQYLPPGDYSVPCCGGSPCSSDEDVGNNPDQVTPFDNYDSFYECLRSGDRSFGECCNEAGCDAAVEHGGQTSFCLSIVDPCKSCEYYGGTCYDTEEECICGCNKSWQLDNNTVWPNIPCKCIEVCGLPPEPPWSFETEEECNNSLTYEGTGRPVTPCTGGQPMIADSFGQSNRLEVDYESTNSLSNAKLNENGQISSENAINKENNNTILPKNVSIFL